MSSLDSFLNGFGSAVSGTIANKAHAHPSWLNYEKDIVSWSVLRRLGTRGMRSRWRPGLPGKRPTG